MMLCVVGTGGDVGGGGVGVGGGSAVLGVDGVGAGGGVNKVEAGVVLRVLAKATALAEQFGHRNCDSHFVLKKVSSNNTAKR